MTREEAANIIKSECYACNLFNLDWTTKVNTALDVAVESLEKEPCNDAISKSDVFEILGNLMSIPYDFDRPINEKDVSESMDEIRALPSVTPARPKGHWIDYSEEGFVECPECGIGLQDWHRVERDGDDDISFHEYEFRFCPNCGCKMSKGGKE